MTARSIALVLVAACGGGDRIEGSGSVVSLSDAELMELCEQFHDDTCRGRTIDECGPTCRATCSDATTPELMRVECAAPITVDQVNECAVKFGALAPDAFAVCQQGGGCVFDVFDETCR